LNDKKITREKSLIKFLLRIYYYFFTVYLRDPEVFDSFIVFTRVYDFFKYLILGIPKALKKFKIFILGIPEALKKFKIFILEVLKKFKIFILKLPTD